MSALRVYYLNMWKAQRLAADKAKAAAKVKK